MFGKIGIRRYCLASLLCLAFAGISATAWAQRRVYARVDPNPDGVTEKLFFDINSEPTDNVAPNVVFSADGQRGYVAYTRALTETGPVEASGTIVVFSVETGEILDRVRTGGSPVFLTLLADGKSIAAVSVWDNRIFVLDTETDTFKTYTFPNAFFGFGSVLTVSPDGTTGYISSILDDLHNPRGEVIKFDLATGEELGRLGNLVKPAQITLTPDGSTLIVVDTSSVEGSDESDRLVFADCSAMKQKATLTNTDPSYTTFNLTKDSKVLLAPDGETGIVASCGYGTGVSFEEVLYFDLSDTNAPKMIKQATIGVQPGYSAITPDGKKWVILNQYSLTVIPTDDFDSLATFTMGAAGNPLPSARIEFSPDSKYVYYTSSADPSTIGGPQDLVFQMELDTGAIVGRVQVGDNPNTYMDEPSSITGTPDGKRMAVVDLGTNKVELLQDMRMLAAGRFTSSTDEFTGVSLVNLSGQTANITMIALTSGGGVYVKENEDDPDLNNPASFTLEPNQQLSKTVSEIFGFDTATERSGWVAIFSDQMDVVGYASIGDWSLNRLDGYPLFQKKAQDMIIPEIFHQDGKHIDLNFMNPNYSQANYTIWRMPKSGGENAIEDPQTLAVQASNQTSELFEDMYGAPAEGVTEGYLRIYSPAGLMLSEIYGGDNSKAILNAIDSDDYKGVTKLYSPQFAIGFGYKTILNVINANGEDADITVTLHGPDGSVLGDPHHETLAKFAQLKDDLASIFGAGVENTTGWLEVDSTKDLILGTVTFTNDQEGFLGSYQLSGTPLSSFIFTVSPMDPHYRTGLALVNDNAEPANVTLELWNTDGTLDQGATATLTLQPGEQTTCYLDSLFPGATASMVGNLRVRSDKPILGVTLLDDPQLDFIMPVTPIPMP